MPRLLEAVGRLFLAIPQTFHQLARAYSAHLPWGRAPRHAMGSCGPQLQKGRALGLRPPAPQQEACSLGRGRREPGAAAPGAALGRLNRWRHGGASPGSIPRPLRENPTPINLCAHSCCRTRTCRPPSTLPLLKRHFPSRGAGAPQAGRPGSWERERDSEFGEAPSSGHLDGRRSSLNLGRRQASAPAHVGICCSGCSAHRPLPHPHPSTRTHTTHPPPLPLPSLQALDTTCPQTRRRRRRGR